MKLTPTDMAALELALELMRAEPDRAEQIEWKLANEGWESAARFAAYHRQCAALNLGSETAPCDIDDPAAALKGPNDVSWHWGEHKAARLVIKMRAHGVSRFDPDPLGAIEAAKRGAK